VKRPILLAWKVWSDSTRTGPLHAAIAQANRHFCVFLLVTAQSSAAQSFQRLLFRKTLANDFHSTGILLRGPLDLALAGVPPGNILTSPFFHFRDSHIDAPRCELSEFQIKVKQRCVSVGRTYARLDARAPLPRLR